VKFVYRDYNLIIGSIVSALSLAVCSVLWLGKHVHGTLVSAQNRDMADVLGSK
jgi:hypothetical protein